MKLAKTYPALQLTTPRNQAEKWFAKGVEQHEVFDRSVKTARRAAIESGFAFLRSRAAFEHGEWEDFVVNHPNINLRTVRFYCQLAEEARHWVLDAHPGLRTLEEIQAAAISLVMQSPKPLIALCRELGHMRKFGEYDAVKYAERKSSPGQIEFHFEKVTPFLDILAHFGDENYEFIFPEGVAEDDFIAELETKLDSALVRLRHIKKHGRVIET